jgi:hypothetical protein
MHIRCPPSTPGNFSKCFSLNYFAIFYKCTQILIALTIESHTNDCKMFTLGPMGQVTLLLQKIITISLGVKVEVWVFLSYF